MATHIYTNGTQTFLGVTGSTTLDPGTGVTSATLNLAGLATTWDILGPATGTLVVNNTVAVASNINLETRGSAVTLENSSLVALHAIGTLSATIDDGGSFAIGGDLLAANVLTSGSISFGTGGGTSIVGTQGSFVSLNLLSAGLGAYQGFANNADAIDDLSLNFSKFANYIIVGSGGGLQTVVVTDTDGTQFSFQTNDSSLKDGFYTSTTTGPLHLITDAHGGTEIVNQPPCFLAGARILTPSGAVPVEDLHVGDAVIAERGGVRAARPIVWVGRRSVRSRDLAPEYAHPVRIRAHAFAPHVPGRDLLLTADHGVLVDGGLVPVRLLVNGGSIVVDERIDEFTYYHVELAEHAILLAEGVPAESYLDTGNRGDFVDAPITNLRPAFGADDARHVWETRAVAPLTVDPPTLEPIWRRLAARAERLGYRTHAPRTSSARELDIRLLADGHAISPVWISDSRMMFSLPRRSRTLKLASAATTWLERAAWIDDRRRLGVPVRRIAYVAGPDEVDLPLDHPSMRDGWHVCEGDAWSFRRWTDGAAEIPVRDDVTGLIVELDGGSMATLYGKGSGLPLAA